MKVKPRYLQALAQDLARQFVEQGIKNFYGETHTVTANEEGQQFEMTVSVQRLGAVTPGERTAELNDKLAQIMALAHTVCHGFAQEQGHAVNEMREFLQGQFEPGKYDNVLRPFYRLMEKELHANAHKGDRPVWLKMTPNECLLEVYHHAAKLQRAIRDGDGAGAVEYATDLGNLGMMMADIYGVLAPVPEG